MFKLLKYSMLYTVTLCLLFTILSGTGHTESFFCKVFLNKKELTNIQPINVNGRIMVPIRKILEYIDADFEWIPDKRMVKINKDKNNIDLIINTPFCWVNGKSVNMDVPALIKQGRTYVPIRFLAESLDMDVHWDQSINAAMISTEAPAYLVSVDKTDSEKKQVSTPTSTPTPTPISTSISTPLPTPSSQNITTDVPSQTPTTEPSSNYQNGNNLPTPSPASPTLTDEITNHPTNMVEDIKLIIDGEELDYKFIGCQLIEEEGILYADNLLAKLVLRVYNEYDSISNGYQLRYFSDDENEGSYTVLNTKPADKNRVPILDVCKELNLQYEYKDHVLYLTYTI
ncbi:copper amine oxidase N-terminal domain-containing protein [Pseudobacteroides cellulosolvens]|uniref:Copper amine oxidase-like domain-containing protein n=1 Tax=Pseudobacteroides cellulosolvens ATCC 35603 = DSM 2933 TaxID=398512 RepID=A0A0L6JTL3_9FIRM|nr:copper amine oxidase N-terminal domain-containing protein [Pseudobacteroides cellulosolvens]KNY29158.1 copper amine oxidase-like domain-containing protein [Pseudobacteroides cellulosolvens ATCC 35603 = DSM 2933]